MPELDAKIGAWRRGRLVHRLLKAVREQEGPRRRGARVFLRVEGVRPAEHQARECSAEHVREVRQLGRRLVRFRQDEREGCVLVERHGWRVC